ncbi:type IV secretion system protein [Pseudochrobactrum sp. AO18b]|uniref:type IV secretion system protein n=1 Tax=Pseudochrobactrum sp. AO18b TaxID=1201036 RepID=UPI00039CA0C9|nr:type IV secretion system protein [Pseudochrobactrum sp. AO18b]
METDFVGKLLQNLDRIGGNFSEAAFSSFDSQIMPLLNVLVITYVAIYGLRLMLGVTSISAAEVVVHLTKVVAVTTLATKWSLFNDLIYSWIIAIPDGVGQLVLNAAGGSTTKTTNGLSAIVEQANTINHAFNAAAGWRNLGPILLGFFVLGIAYFLVGVALMLLMISKVALWILIGTAPLFIACYLFSVSRRLTDGWITQVLAYSLMPVFTYGACAIIIATMKSALSDTDYSTLSLEDLSGLGAIFILVALAGLYILFTIQTMAQGVVGTVMLSAGDFARRAKNISYGAARSTVGTSAKGLAAGYRKFRGGGSDGGSISNASQDALARQVQNHSRPR